MKLDVLPRQDANSADRRRDNGGLDFFYDTERSLREGVVVWLVSEFSTIRPREKGALTIGILS